MKLGDRPSLAAVFGVKATKARPAGLFRPWEFGGRGGGFPPSHGDFMVISGDLMEQSMNQWEYVVGYRDLKGIWENQPENHQHQPEYRGLPIRGLKKTCSDAPRGTLL